MNRRRSWGQDDNGRQRKRRRQDSEPPLPLEDKLESLIVRIGEKNSSPLEKNLEDLSQILNEDSVRYKSNIVKIICECVAEVPEKCGIYATLIGLLNVANYSLAGEIVESIVAHFKEYLKSGQFDKSRSIIRVLGDLVNCHVISASSYLNWLETLVDVTMEAEIPQARSDYYVFVVLSTLPWAARELHDKKEKDLEQLLGQIEAYMNKRSKPHHTALRVWYSDHPHPQAEYLECLWAQINKLKEDKWNERQIFRPYDAFSGQFAEALQNNLPQIQLPPHEHNYIYPYPKVIFRLFEYNDCTEGPVLPGAPSIERFLVEEHCQFLLDQNFYDRKLCAYSLVSFPNSHLIPLEYVVVETILANLFALPTSRHLEVFYGSLLLELCRINPGTFPQVLAQAVERLFDRLDSMNVACVDRFASWFAYHLSNFQFRWTWEDWAQCLNMDPLQPKPKFVRETLSKCMRLSYHQRVVELAPESFRSLMPDLPTPFNKYTTEDGEMSPEFNVVTELMSVFKEKGSPDAVMEVLNKLEAVVGGEDASKLNAFKINVFLTVLLNYASKSFTHLFFMTARYNKVLHQLNFNEEAQLSILTTIFEVWKTHQQLIEVLITKLLKANIITYTAVANFVFSKEMHGELVKSYVWEILHSAIRRQIFTMKNVEKELNELRDPNKKAEFIAKKTEASESVKDGEDMEMVEPESLEEKIEKLEEKFDNLQSEQKNLFLTIFQRFIMLLSEHIQSCEIKGKSFKNHWFRWCIGRLQQIFYEHHQYIFNYVSTLESLLFTSDLDQHILLIFKQFSSLRA